MPSLLPLRRSRSRPSTPATRSARLLRSLTHLSSRLKALLGGLLCCLFLLNWYSHRPSRPRLDHSSTTSTLNRTQGVWRGGLSSQAQHAVSLVPSLRESLQSSTDLTVKLSTRWIPTSMSICEDITPFHWAPCVAARKQGLNVFGEELLYPDFKLREPRWVGRQGERDRQLWFQTVSTIAERGVPAKEGGWISYRGQHGQNLAFINAKVLMDVAFDSWSSAACMGDSSAISVLLLDQESTQPTDHSSLLIASSPDSWSFQHFLDRSTHIVQQGSHLTLLDNRRAVLTGRKGSDRVQEMWSFLGYAESKGQLAHSKKEVSADRIVFSCRAPLVHPWLSLASIEAFGIDHGSKSVENRKLVVYVSRSNGRTKNSGRKVLNEDVLLESMRTLLASRQQGEELYLFDETAFGSTRETIDFLHDHTRAIVGPHGGGLYHHRWTGNHTLVLELLPTTVKEMMFYEEASLLDQAYRPMFFNASTPTGTDFEVDVDSVLEVLDEQLGRGDPRGETVREEYKWDAPDVGLGVVGY